MVMETPRLGGVAIVYLCFPRLTTWSRTWWWLHFLVWCGSTKHLRHYLPSTWIPYKHVQQKIRYKRHGEYCKTKRLNILLNLVLLSWISKVEYARNMNEKGRRRKGECAWSLAMQACARLPGVDRTVGKLQNMYTTNLLLWTDVYDSLSN